MKIPIEEVRGYYTPLGFKAAFARSTVSIAPEFVRRLVAMADSEKRLEGALVRFEETHGIEFIKAPDRTYDEWIEFLRKEFPHKGPLLWSGETESAKFTLVIVPPSDFDPFAALSAAGKL